VISGSAYLAISEVFRGIPHVDCPRRKIPKGYGARAEDGSFAYGHTGTNESLSCHPGEWAYFYRTDNKLEIWILDVMTPGT
jgi:hypothetical protein